MKYVLHSNGKEHSSVHLSPYQQAHLPTKGFAFGLEILRLANDSPSMGIDYITIEDDNNTLVVIHEDQTDYKQSLTLGAKHEYAQNTDQQLRHLHLMETLEG